MKSLVLENRTAAVEERPVPRAHDEWVVVKLEATPICGSDKKHFLSPTPVRYAGHEGTGVVVETDRTNLLKVGDRVLTNCLSGCGKCAYCRSGNYVFCEKRLPFDQMPSHFAEYALVQDFLCVPLPEDISFENGSLAGCALAPSFNTLQRMEIQPSDLLVVTGCGPVGLGAVAIAKHYGARVIAVEAVDYRKDLAGRIGADLVLGGGPDLEQRLLKATDGERPNKALDASGYGPLQSFCIDVVGGMGRVGLVGHSPAPLSINTSADVLFKGLTIYGSWHVNLNDIPKLFDVIRRSPHAADLITHRFNLEQAQEAFDTFLSGESGKIVFLP